MSSGADHESPEAPSLAALKAEFADVPRPDTRPLTEAEKTALRDRLNSARPGETVKLTHREHTARTEMGIIRAREDVVSLYELVQGGPPPCPTRCASPSCSPPPWGWSARRTRQRPRGAARGS
ncbi:hypothetical protein [Actinomadura sp. RB99]|uniref:hypothetical protein n=1 Tax=Actinomadura sp. RB99 TaxID=2691577 RepID=UPI00168A3FA8|nr:hypothetical protein [Actinomadura sp. RB99]